MLLTNTIKVANKFTAFQKKQLRQLRRAILYLWH